MSANTTKDAVNLTTRIPQMISDMFRNEDDGNVAFEAYILINKQKSRKNQKPGKAQQAIKTPKSCEDQETKLLKRFVLFEGAPNNNDVNVNFKLKIQNVFAKVIREKFGAKAAYDLAENIADDQNKFYIIPQSKEYHPFNFIDVPNLDDCESYSINDSECAEGIFFRYARQNHVIWAFQYFWPTAIPNRKGLGFHIIPQDDVFVELTKPILAIMQKIDLLVINNHIITDNINLLQTHYQFQNYILSSAKHIISEIETLNIVSNIDKFKDYIARSERTTYAKKVLRLKDSKVLTKSKDELFKKLTTLPRWRGRFDINAHDHTINLKTYTDVEALIDLLDERYTRSDVTNEEYDTSAKKWIGPAN